LHCSPRRHRLLQESQRPRYRRCLRRRCRDHNLRRRQGRGRSAAMDVDRERAPSAGVDVADGVVAGVGAAVPLAGSPTPNCGSRSNLAHTGGQPGLPSGRHDIGPKIAALWPGWCGIAGRSVRTSKRREEPSPRKQAEATLVVAHLLRKAQARWQSKGARFPRRARTISTQLSKD